MKRRINRTLGLVLSLVFLVGIFPVGLPVAGADDSLNVSVSISGTAVSIGNSLIQRNFGIAGGTVATTSIENKISGITFIPGANSNDFILNVNQIKPASADPVEANLIRSGTLTLAGAPTSWRDGETTFVRFVFQPAVKFDIPWTITYVLYMTDGNNWINSFLEIGVPQADRARAHIVSIDYDAFYTGGLPNSVLWGYTPASSDTGMNHRNNMFGQPLYVNSFFFGAEFPIFENRFNPYLTTANNGSNRVMTIRYYSGKNFNQLKCNAAGNFVCWPGVVGAARSAEKDEVKDDFFEYGYTFIQGADFRTQMNTWYAGGMMITPQSVGDVFQGIEQGVTQAGVAPMDSYVLDDGINDYSGPFWGLKPAFKNDAIKGLSNLCTDMGGAFGSWIGPAGGYASQRQAPWMQAAGTGYAASNATNANLCFAAPLYQQNIKNMQIWRMDEWNINYWKTDGMGSTCTNNGHGHMTGGTISHIGSSMVYYTTELWENATQMFTEMKADQKSKGRDMFINVTIASVPSVWALKYVNTTYITNNEDDGITRIPNTDMGAARTLYRDGSYYMFFIDRDLQIPYPFIWNHDPIYSSLRSNFAVLTDQQFRNYMYANAMRGPRVWELLIDYAIFTEGQWMATKEVLDFAQKTQDIFLNAKLLAGNSFWGPITRGTATEAANNPYAYSAWTKDEGYLSFRNPSGANTRTISLELNLAAGVKRGMKDLTMTYVLPSKIDPGIVQNRKETYSFGDTITVTLAPMEMVILHFGEKDTTPPEFIRTEVKDASTVRVTFNEAIELSGLPTVAGHTVTAAALTADFLSVDIAVAEPFADNELITITGITVKDLSANAATVTATARYAAERIVSQFSSAADLLGSPKVAYDDLLGSDVLFLDGNTVGLPKAADMTNKLTVASLIHTICTDATVIEQAGAYTIGINEEGKIEFTVAGLTVTSKNAINDGTWHHFACVKEPNELLKIYIDGVIDASAYEGATLKVLHSAPVSVGSKEFKGELSQIAVYNTALGYKDIAAIALQPLFEHDIVGNNAYTIVGLAPKLPGTLQARYDATKYFRNYSANWSAIEEADFAAPGKVDISATLPDFDGLDVEGKLSVLPAWPAISSMSGTVLADVLAGMKADGWEVKNEVTSRLAVNASGIAITAQPSKMDRGNVDPTFPTYKAQIAAGTADVNNIPEDILPDVVNENFFLKDPGVEDYCVTVRMNGTPANLNNQAGLIIMQDDDNFVRMTYRISGSTGNGGRASMSLNVQNDGYDFTLEPGPANPTGRGTNNYWLALDKKGEYYTGYYSLDGNVWVSIGTVRATLENAKVGFYAAQGVRLTTSAAGDPVWTITYTPAAFSPRFANFEIRQNSVGLTIPADTAGELNQLWGYDAPRYIWADTTFSDGSEGSLLVDLPLGLDTSVPGTTYDVIGTVAGSTRTIPVTVNILPTDWTGVGNAIALFESLKKVDWTAASWAAALPFYNAAVAAYGDPTIKQYDADAIEEALLAAVDALKPVIRELWLDASVYQYPGNKNDLTITVFEVWTDGVVFPVTQTITISNNAAGTYTVGPYKVYVNTKGNDQIRELYLVTPPKLPTETGVRPS